MFVSEKSSSSSKADRTFCWGFRLKYLSLTERAAEQPESLSRSSSPRHPILGLRRSPGKASSFLEPELDPSQSCSRHIAGLRARVFIGVL